MHLGHLFLNTATVLFTAAVPVAPTPCTDDPAYHLLDFWVGSWDVYVGDTLDGHDRVSQVLANCAVTEEWADADGSHGFSLFYYQPGAVPWRQVWVTDRAFQTGGLKEKQLIERLGDGAVRFQGAIIGPAGTGYLDRTTLTPLASGEVRQVIEISRDQGGTWRSVYDARYRRSPGSAGF